MTAPDRQDSSGRRPRSDTLAPGTRLQNLEIRAVLGVGDFHVTYRGWDLRRDCPVVVHEYFPSDLARRADDGLEVTTSSADASEAFEFGLNAYLQEARQLAQVHDPNIVRVVAYAEAHGTAYMVSEFEEGETLAEFLATSHSSVDEAGLQAILRPVLAGLRTVHAAGLLHRGIRPHSIRLRRQGPPLLVEFANARIALAARRGKVDDALTPAYSAFEQSHDRSESGPWTDLYGFGATLYHCISGHPPTSAADRLWAVAEQEEDPLVPAIEVGAGRYPNGLLATIDWMIRPFAVDRPQSVDALTGLLGNATPRPTRPAVTPVESRQAKAESPATPEAGSRRGQSAREGEQDPPRPLAAGIAGRPRPSLFAARAERLSRQEAGRGSRRQPDVDEELEAGTEVLPEPAPPPVPPQGSSPPERDRAASSDWRRLAPADDESATPDPSNGRADGAADAVADRNRPEAGEPDEAIRPPLHELVPGRTPGRPTRPARKDNGHGPDADFDPDLMREARRARASGRARRRRSAVIAAAAALAVVAVAAAWWWDDVRAIVGGESGPRIGAGADPVTAEGTARTGEIETAGTPTAASAIPADPSDPVVTEPVEPIAAVAPPDTPPPADTPAVPAAEPATATEEPAAATAADASPPAQDLEDPATAPADGEVAAAAVDTSGAEAQARISELIAAADRAMERGRLGYPPDDNAWLHYSRILEIDPDNEAGHGGLLRVAEGYVELARYAVSIDRSDRALQYLDRAEEVVPGLESARLQREVMQVADSGETHIELAPAAETAQAQAAEPAAAPAEPTAPAGTATAPTAPAADDGTDPNVAELLTLAREARSAGRYTSPPGDNALWYYQSILVIDGGSEQARAGIAELVDYHLELATEALQRGDESEAEAYLSTASAIAPQSERVRVLRDRIRERRESEAAARAAEAEEQRRQAEATLQQQRAQEAEAALQEGVRAYYENRYDEAFRQLIPLARQGDPRAQFRVGVMYDRGRGVARNRNLAEQWISTAAPAIREAAEAGIAWAQADLGSMYDEGWTVSQNLTEAVRWYTAAADQGYAGAQTNLGVLMWAGRGVARDRERALDLLRKAAAQGDFIAQQNLDQLGVR